MLIPHRHNLRRAVFHARYDRFIAELSLDGRFIEAHCVNPGRMEGLVRPGTPAWVSEVAPDSPRKLRYTLELLKLKGRYVGVNTNMPNYLAGCLLRARQVPGLKRYREIRSEVPYGTHSRVDFLLTQGARYHYLEVKNCHLVYPDGGAYFPDSVSSRAARHLEELGRMISQGHKASVLFTVQRNDARFVRPSDMHDPTFAAAARAAHQRGVRFLAACFEPSLQGFTFLGLRPVYLGLYSYQHLMGYREARLPFSGWIRRGARSTAKTSPVRRS
ncbi:MAG: DNA/RNA nuclease SfsA [Pseudomonadota bacterium]